MEKYCDIVSYIINEISNENIESNNKLPTVRELSEVFKCSKSTVVRAYNELKKNHIVYSIPQSGYYLVENKKKTYKDLKENVMNFASAAPDESVLPYEEFQHCLNQAINKYKEILFNYSEARGLPSLVDVLNKYFQSYQVFCNKENIFITAGSQQAINILLNMPFPNGKNNVLVEQPTYNGVLKSLELSNVQVIGIERKDSGIDFDELERKFANGNIKCFYTISRFHNPLGVSYSNEDKKQILKLANKYDVYIIEDDYLADLEIKNNSYPIYYYDTFSRVVYLKSFSKILLPGLRVGVVVVPKVLINIFNEYKKWADLGTSVVSQGALEIYIKSGMFNAHGKKIKNIYSSRMKLLKNKAMELSLNHIKWYIPDTGFFASIEFLKNININNLINNLRVRNICIDDIKKNYLSNYSNKNILKISIARTNLHYIEKGVPVIIDEISKIEKEKSFNLDIFNI